MKDISVAMNQTSSGAINGWLYPPPNGNKHKLIPHSQCHTVSQTGTYRAALLVHHLHFMSTSELRRRWCSIAGGLVIDYWQAHRSAREGDRNKASIFFSLNLYRGKDALNWLKRERIHNGQFSVCLSCFVHITIISLLLFMYFSLRICTVFSHPLHNTSSVIKKCCPLVVNVKKVQFYCL